MAMLMPQTGAFKTKNIPKWCLFCIVFCNHYRKKEKANSRRDNNPKYVSGADIISKNMIQYIAEQKKGAGKSTIVVLGTST